jgi:hypothetical protein
VRFIALHDAPLFTVIYMPLRRVFFYSSFSLFGLYAFVVKYAKSERREEQSASLLLAFVERRGLIWASSFAGIR